MAGQDAAWLGMLWCGKAGSGRQGMARQRFGKLCLGAVWRGGFSCGPARRDMARQARFVKVRYGDRGLARFGQAS